ncbi:type II toxin-antitoxin system VapB family antitoxin [Sphingomonas sp. 36D10-4-7]|uniref:Type II toxin-antitoxin system VapB family antitoxin n=1 Tax=Sphingomonas corticis TaxID=2722791 RepID=A0ABX1CTM9_9SPHN|nr:type II toxin-antitoxin system VapB family antitoxin [Sphingomonas corticis]
MFHHAAQLSGIDDEKALIAEAMRALIAREASASLAALGGSMPDYREPTRERS